MIVEQKVEQVLSVADRVLALRIGKLEFDGSESGVSPALATVGKSEVTAEQVYTTISLGMGF